jgi:hypothetical protein
MQWCIQGKLRASNHMKMYTRSVAFIKEYNFKHEALGPHRSPEKR